MLRSIVRALVVMTISMLARGVLATNGPTPVSSSRDGTDTRLLPAGAALLVRQPGAVATAQEATPVDGGNTTCDLFRSAFDPIQWYIFSFEFPPGWVWVVHPTDPNDRAGHIRSLTGWVTDSFPTHKDFPSAHFTHDVDVHVRPDPGFEGLVSNGAASGEPGELNQGEISAEWEFGTLTNEVSGDPPERTFPRWAWPSTGDRVFISGNWVFDCGHRDSDGRYLAEIHPMRAIASMRPQVHTMPGTGTTPVRVTSTDLYIHGRAGLVTDILDCGLEIMVGSGSCGPSAYPGRPTPIDDDYDFNVCLPSQPSTNALLVVSMTNGPGNTVTRVQPVLTPQPSAGPCAGAGFGPTQLHVHVPLAGTGVSADDVFARRIDAGWVFPQGVHHVTANLTRGALHDDMELDGFDAKLSFFWINAPSSSDEWFRLTPYEIPTDGGVGQPDYCIGHTNTLDAWDSDDGLPPCNGNGRMNFSGPDLDFYVLDTEGWGLRTQAYDQDCLDERYGTVQIGDNILGVIVPNPHGLAILDCYIAVHDLGDNDLYDVATAVDLPPGHGQRLAPASNQFELFFDVTSTEVDDSADLAITKECPARPLSGQPFSCTVTVTNAGPGLPREVVVTDTLTSPNITAAHYSIGTPTYSITNGLTSAPGNCSAPVGGSFDCNLGTVPVGGTAVITVQVTPDRGGTFVNDADVASASDPDLANNHAEARVDVVQVVPIDIKPGDPDNPVKVSLAGSGGKIPVAILSTPDFSAPERVDRASLTFGRTGNEASLSSCSSERQDVNKDGRPDLVCSFKNDPRLFRPGDTNGILRGKTVDSPAILIQGTDKVTPVP